MGPCLKTINEKDIVQNVVVHPESEVFCYKHIKLVLDSPMDACEFLGKIYDAGVMVTGLFEPFASLPPWTLFHCSWNGIPRV